MRSKILKTLAVISFGLVTFPLVLTNDVLSFGDISPMRITAYYCGFGLIFLLGYFLSLVASRHKRLLALERIVGILSFSAGFSVLFATDEPAVIIALGVSSVLWYFLGERAFKKHYADIFPAYMLGVYIGVTLLCYLFFGAMCFTGAKEPVLEAVIGAFMAELCLAALLINQSAIYDKANRRRETRTMLPKGLSGYNALLVIGITLFGLFFYFFSDNIVWLLKEIARLLIYAVLWLLKGNTEFVAPESAEQGDMGQGFFTQASYSFWNIIFIVLLVTALVVFRKKIFAFFKGLFERIAGFLFREPAQSEEEPEFVDVFEELSSSKRDKRNQSSAQLLRLYKNETDSVQKYRYGYRLLIRRLKELKTDIVPSDTVRSQQEKGRAVCGAELEQIADCYGKLRYGGCPVTKEQLDFLDKFMKNIGAQ